MVNAIDRDRITSVLERGDLNVELQPICDLRGGPRIGYEVLARFYAEPQWSPDVWFRSAAAVGLGEELELLAVRTALDLLHELPDDTTVSINVSPTVAASYDLLRLVAPVAERVILEVTEHAQISDYFSLEKSLRRLRVYGARLAVDDVGAGFATLRHILGLCPDLVKLDVSLIRDIDGDPWRRALAASLVTFAREIDATIVAEGIETIAEFELLRELGIRYGQGFYLGRPQPLLSALTSTMSMN